jgi:hypothetical protein
MANKDGKVLMQLRLSQEEARDLRAAAEAQSRTLPAEIMQRLRLSLTGAETEMDQALYGWSKESITRNRALGQALGCLAARLERVIGQSEDHHVERASLFATLKKAVPVLLDRLGGKDEYLTGNDMLAANAIAVVFARDLSTAVQLGDAAAFQSTEAAALARVARGIDAPLREWAKKSSTDGTDY